jgi:hypothetical protein
MDQWKTACPALQRDCLIIIFKKQHKWTNKRNKDLKYSSGISNIEKKSGITIINQFKKQREWNAHWSDDKEYTNVCLIMAGQSEFRISPLWASQIEKPMCYRERTDPCSGVSKVALMHV